MQKHIAVDCDQELLMSIGGIDEEGFKSTFREDLAQLNSRENEILTFERFGY